MGQCTKRPVKAGFYQFLPSEKKPGRKPVLKTGFNQFPTGFISVSIGFIRFFISFRVQFPCLDYGIGDGWKPRNASWRSPGVAKAVPGPQTDMQSLDPPTEKTGNRF